MSLSFKNFPRGNTSGTGNLVFRHMGNEIPADPSTYIEFSSSESFTLSTRLHSRGWDGELFYSTNRLSWFKWDGSVISSSIDENLYKLYIRGIENHYMIPNKNTGYSWILIGNNVSCHGNIENLLDYVIVASGNHPEMADGCYYRMFESCYSLTTAPQLPATTLTSSCYTSMFESCSSLTTAPQLPATTLTSSCYEGMFRYCTSLTTAPQLPATTLALACYLNMFERCSSLTTAPQLPATTLTARCYASMFRYCTSLTTAPQLPATTLTSSCYTSMFSNCTSLAVYDSSGTGHDKVWKIPTSGTITDYITQDNMFYGCPGDYSSRSWASLNRTFYTQNTPI